MPLDSTAVAAFLDREAAAAVVTGYAGAPDARDWSAYRALFSDAVAIDYGAIGSIVATVPADQWTDRCRTLEGFDETAHRINNISVEIDGDRAAVASIVDAAHFVRLNGDTLMGDIIGRYTHELIRNGGWKISGVVLEVVGYPAGKAAFDAAFAVARAIYAGRQTG